MSQENIELVRKVSVLGNAQQWDVMFEHFRADIEWRDLMHAPDVPEVVNGVDGVRALVSQWDELYDQFTAEVLDYIDADPWVVCDTRWHGKGAGSGVPVEVRSVDAYEVRDGKIARTFGGFPDVTSALEAVRLAD